MNPDILRHAEEGKFTEFSNAVKTELKSKLANNPVIKQHTDDYDKIQDMKASFAKINTDFGTPETEE